MAQDNQSKTSAAKSISERDAVSHTTELFELQIKTVTVKMLIDRLSTFDDRSLLHQLLLCRHGDVRARQQDSDTNEQNKLPTYTHAYRRTDRQR